MLNTINTTIGCSCVKNGIRYTHDTCTFPEKYKLYVSLFGDSFDLVGCAPTYSDVVKKLVELYFMYKASTDLAIKVLVMSNGETIVYTDSDLKKIDTLFSKLNR